MAQDKGQSHEEPNAPEDAASFRALLDRRGVEALTCPACGARDEWGGFADVPLRMIVDRHNTDPGPTLLDGSIHALMASCGRCGFIAFFDREVIGD